MCRPIGTAATATPAEWLTDAACPRVTHLTSGLLCSVQTHTHLQSCIQNVGSNFEDVIGRRLQSKQTVKGVCPARVLGQLIACRGAQE